MVSTRRMSSSLKVLIKNENAYSSEMSVRLGIKWAALRIFALDLGNLNSLPDHSASFRRYVPF